jgi:lipid-A-disaccharide synthase
MNSKNNHQPSLFLFSGEQSGDAHGADFLKAFKEKYPRWNAFGVAGPKLRKEGLEPIAKMEDFQIIGFAAVVTSFPKIWRQFKFIQDTILARNPELCVLVDYPGFNIRLAASLRKHGYRGKIVQYVCPSVWAWGKGRIKTMVENLDMLLTIFPFEKECFTGTSLPVRYVGNPLLRSLDTYEYNEKWKQELQIPSKKDIIGIFPGSRKGELKNNLHRQLKSVERFCKKHPGWHVAVSCSHEKHAPLIQKVLQSTSPSQLTQTTIVPPKYSRELMRDSHTALATAGTVTLELALQQTPTIAAYHITALNHLMGRYILNIHLPYYCLPNIIAKTAVFPELIAIPFLEKLACDLLEHLTQDPYSRQRSLEGCQEVHRILSNQETVKNPIDCIGELL